MKTEYQFGLKTLLDTQNDLLEHEVKETETSEQEMGAFPHARIQVQTKQDSV